MGRRRRLRWWPLVAAALLCACSQTPGERSTDERVGVSARTDKVDPAGPATTRDWLNAMVGRLQDKGSVPFTATVRIMGNEAMVIDGEASRSGFRVAITQVGTATGEVLHVQRIESEAGRVRSMDEKDGRAGTWQEEEWRGLQGGMAGGFRPRGIDLVNLLDTMVLLPRGTAEGTATPAEVDLATAYTAVMGVKAVRPGGGSAIPTDSRLRVELVERPSGARQLLLEGDALAEALQGLGIGSGGLAGWYEALEITVVYPPAA